MKSYKPTAAEKRKYILPTQRDLEILMQCKQLEQKKLSRGDKRSVKLIKTQLILNWRKPLLEELNKLLKKYRKNKPK